MIFTINNSSCGKVMLSQASVILSTGGTYMAVLCIVGGMHDMGACMMGGIYG